MTDGRTKDVLLNALKQGMAGRDPLQLGGTGAGGTAALGEHALAPGGEVAFEVRDEVTRRVAEGAVRGVNHVLSIGASEGNRRTGARNSRILRRRCDRPGPPTGCRDWAPRSDYH